MDRKKITRHAQKKLDHLKKYTHAMAQSDNEEDVREFRVGYKDLRSYLRLTMDIRHPEKTIKQLDKVKKVYSLAGELRGLQLHRKNIFSADTAFYDASLGQKEKSIRSKLRKASRNLHFKKIEKQIIKQLPTRLPRKDIVAFIISNAAAIDNLLQSDITDTQLHDVRKHLKDILYIIKVLKAPLSKCFPIANKVSVRQLKTLADMLNEHQDLAVSIGLLQHAPARYRSHPQLLSMVAQWQLDKLLIKRKILKYTLIA